MDALKSFIDSRFDGIKDFIRGQFDGLKDYLYDVTIGQAKSEISEQLTSYANDLQSIFVLVAIVGIYCTMAGERKAGAKITSLSIITFLIARVVFAAYGY